MHRTAGIRGRRIDLWRRCHRPCPSPERTDESHGYSNRDHPRPERPISRLSPVSRRAAGRRGPRRARLSRRSSRAPRWLHRRRHLLRALRLPRDPDADRPARDRADRPSRLLCAPIPAVPACRLCRRPDRGGAGRRLRGPPRDRESTEDASQPFSMSRTGTSSTRRTGTSATTPAFPASPRLVARIEEQFYLLWPFVSSQSWRGDGSGRPGHR